MPTTVEQKRNVYALDVRLHGPESAEATASKAEFVTEKITTFVARAVADAPPLSESQVERIVRALARPASLVSSSPTET